MQMNVGMLDRLARAVLGLALISLVFWGPRSPLGWLGLVLIGTSVFRFCPLYRLVGISTCRAAGKP